jgi:tetratricopeptide (TPR) repeat protein
MFFIRKHETSQAPPQLSTTGLAGGCAISLQLARLSLVACCLHASTGQAQSKPVDSPAAVQFHRAVKLAEQGNQAEALVLTNSLLQEHPSFEPALKLQGVLLEQTGHDNEAAVSYEKALKLAPNDPDLLFNVGVHALVTGDRDRAILLLQHHLRLLPSDGDGYFYLAQAYHLKGKDDLALKAISQCVKLEPDNAAAAQKYGELLCSSGDNENGLKWLLKAKRTDPSLVHLDYDIASADFKLMDSAGAAEYAAQAIAASPGDLHALQLLASAQLKLTHWQDAKGSFAKILASNKDDSESLLGLGQSDLELKDYQGAIDALNQTLRIDPTRIVAHFYLSRAFAGLGNTAEAQHQAALHHLMMEQVSFVRSVETEQRESAINPDARRLLSNHQENAALQLYRDRFKGTSATPADAYVFIGKLYLFSGDTENGLRCLHHALELQPSVRGAHTYEGILDLKNGNLAKAEAQFNADLANDPNYQTAIAEIGEVRYRQGRWQEAADQLAKSRTTTPELLYMLCDSYFHLAKAHDADLTAETTAAYGRGKPALIDGLIALLKANGQLQLAETIETNRTK